MSSMWNENESIKNPSHRGEKKRRMRDKGIGAEKCEQP